MLDVVVASPMVVWATNIRKVIKKWYDYTVNGVPYEALMKRILLGFVDGGSDLFPYHDPEAMLPQEIKDAVEEVRATIVASDLVVSLNGKIPERELKAFSYQSWKTLADNEDPHRD